MMMKVGMREKTTKTKGQEIKQKTMRQKRGIDVAKVEETKYKIKKIKRSIKEWRHERKAEEEDDEALWGFMCIMDNVASPSVSLSKR